MPGISKNFTGLTAETAVNHLKKYGYNELPSSDERGFLRILLDVMKEPMLFLLLAAGAIYFVLGDAREAVILLSFVVVVIGITLYQENKTEKALTALKNLSSPRALVIRGGEQISIAGREVVPEDIMIVNEGDRVPADALLLSGYNLTVDESLLSGESVPVGKEPAEKTDTKFERPGGENTPFLYSGSLVVQGQGIAKVVSTGLKTEIGKIGKALQTADDKETGLQKEIRKIIKTFFIIAMSLVAIVIILSGIYRGNWLSGILSGITLAMAILPEELPVVLTIFLAVGAWRISQKKVLARKIAAVEILGAADVLCVDKTGTLTQNRMQVQKLVSADGSLTQIGTEISNISKDHDELLEYAILACKPVTFDPMELAIKKTGSEKTAKSFVHDDWSFQMEYPLSKRLMALSNVWQTPADNRFVIASKGAPEAIMDLCHLSKDKIDEIEKDITMLAGEGLRVLGVAKSKFIGEKFLFSQHDYEFEFLGLIALADPIRPTVAEAVTECYQAGIRLIMITGDYPITAKNIAKQIGIKNYEKIVTGKELEAMTADELKQEIQTANIFARMIPEQKLLIVNALKASGKVVAMTGDGVNDAPALKSADIGVAMGEKGTDVAREASDLVLLNNDFSYLVSAIRLGRRIFDNLKKAMTYTVAVHIPIAGVSLAPLLFDWPNILYPVHIVFLELIIDPTCSIVFESEPEEKNIMKRPPRDADEHIFSRQNVTASLLQGLFSLFLVILIFILAIYLGQSEAEARTLAFATLVIINLALILANRSHSRNFFDSFRVKNKALLWIMTGTVSFLALAVYQPAVRKIFHFSALGMVDVALIFGAGILSLGWFELTETVSEKNTR
jgi:Ca2+-transporting ATPase